MTSTAEREPSFFRRTNTRFLGGITVGVGALYMSGYSLKTLRPKLGFDMYAAEPTLDFQGATPARVAMMGLFTLVSYGGFRVMSGAIREETPVDSDSSTENATGVTEQED